MARQIVVGIDIGSFETKVIMAEGQLVDGHFVPKIIGTGTASTKGVERGYITNTSEASQSVRLAVTRAEKISGVRVRRAYVSFGGLGLGSLTSSASVTISRADMEITERDLALVLETQNKPYREAVSSTSASSTSSLSNIRLMGKFLGVNRSDSKLTSSRSKLCSSRVSNIISPTLSKQLRKRT